MADHGHHHKIHSCPQNPFPTTCIIISFPLNLDLDLLYLSHRLLGSKLDHNEKVVDKLLQNFFLTL